MVTFTEETEKFLSIIFILLFGGLLANGLLSRTNVAGVAVAVIIVVILRPLVGFLGMLRSNFDIRKKRAIAFFGFKGIGSFFYLAYTLTQSNFEAANQLYAITAWTFLLSITVHGTTGLRVISCFEKYNPG